MKPKLRSLDINPIERQGEEYWHFHDRIGIAADAAVPREFGPLLGLFDGTRDAAAIVATYAQRGGEDLPQEFVENLIAQLDEGLLLDSPHFAARFQAITGEFAAEPTRPAAFAGLSYPAQPDALREMLGEFFEEAAAFQVPSADFDAARLRGVVVPHIDFMRGGAVEALAYHQLANQEFDVFVILGIAHCGVRYPFCGAAKSYDTPFGTAPVDEEFMAALQDRVGERLTAEQFVHRSEHSIEFVAVFLQYLEHLKNARIVPILCGGFHDEVRRGVSPLQNPDIASFCATLREVVLEWRSKGQRVGLIASVDLSHVGARFGDESQLTQARLSAIEKDDREFLACAELGSAEALHAHIARDENARNVDAHPALFTLLAAFPELRAQLLEYSQAYDEAANSVVSFASMTLYEN